jgi:type I restriction enzyme M protein
VPVSEIEAEDFNCNIRRYVDNAPPPEPHDVRAHLRGGVPVTEIDTLCHFWKNYAGLRERVFIPRPASQGAGTAYADFAPAVTDRRALAELVKADPGLASAHAEFLETLDSWWAKSLPLVEVLAPTNSARGNVYELRRQLLSSITAEFVGQGLLNDHQVRGAFARYMDDLKADLKSIAASGWGAELIPDAELLQSQFPELLAEMEQKRLRLAELTAMFAAADEEDYEDSDTGLLPGGEVKALKAQLKELNAQAKLARREKNNGDWESYKAEAGLIEQRLARHKAFDDEGRQLKSDLRANEKKQQELVEAARAKIDTEEARRVIVDRLYRLLVETYSVYLRADQRACVAAFENLHAKYKVTAKVIEAAREAAAATLKGFLVELGYE